ncbi:MAG TPA: hypothetical protein VEX38_04205, partial [Fimbriimonadaceae bacterium]|nr:hypothetical protein [Fimbriimonadaceae bacterium]
LSIGISHEGSWVIRADDAPFPLDNINDFYRAWLLLERPFFDVKRDLDRLASAAGATSPFPYWKLVGSAMKARSLQWTELAMAWVPLLAAAERTHLRELLLETRESRWASQKVRQLARKYLSQIERMPQSDSS